jgi:CheY-like chemotaxis protein
MDGLEATAAIRRSERTSGGRTPIVALTAHAMKGDRERFLAAGFDAHLPKPIQAVDLSLVIDDVSMATKGLHAGAGAAKQTF